MRLRRLAPLLLVLATAGCPSRLPERVLEVEPTYITFLRHGSGKTLQDLDAAGAFKAAEEAFANGEVAAALRIYRMVAENETDPGTRRDALHNAGLCAIALEDYAAALDALQAALGLPGSEEERGETLALAGQCQARLGRWEEARESFRRALATDGLPILLRAEVLVQTGRGDLLRDALEEAEIRLDESQTLILDAVEIRAQQGHALLGESFYLRGEIYRTLCGRVKMRLPQERMERDLVLKRNLFREAERFYTLAVRVRNGTWSCRAGWSLGQMAEQFAEDLRSSEVPPELDAEARAIYFQELEPFVRSILGEARDYYQRTVDMAGRMGFANEWVERCRQRLELLPRKE